MKPGDIVLGGFITDLDETKVRVISNSDLDVFFADVFADKDPKTKSFRDVAAILKTDRSGDKYQCLVRGIQFLEIDDAPGIPPPAEDILAAGRSAYKYLLNSTRADINRTGVLKVYYKGKFVGYAQNGLSPMTIRRKILLEEHCKGDEIAIIFVTIKPTDGPSLTRISMGSRTAAGGALIKAICADITAKGYKAGFSSGECVQGGGRFPHTLLRNSDGSLYFSF